MKIRLSTTALQQPSAHMAALAMFLFRISLFQAKETSCFQSPVPHAQESLAQIRPLRLGQSNALPFYSSRGSFPKPQHDCTLYLPSFLFSLSSQDWLFLEG